MTLRLAFMGTPDFAVPTLAELIAQGHEIAAVYSQPPRPKGRGMVLEPGPVHKFAEAAKLEVRTPLSLKGADEQAAFAALELDAAIVVAYGLLLPKPILEADGMLATCLQHEMDHLNGVLFIDHLSRLKRSMAIKKLTKAKKLKETA